MESASADSPSQTLSDNLRHCQTISDYLRQSQIPRDNGFIELQKEMDRVNSKLNRSRSRCHYKFHKCLLTQSGVRGDIIYNTWPQDNQAIWHLVSVVILGGQYSVEGGILPIKMSLELSLPRHHFVSDADEVQVQISPKLISGIHIF